MTNQLKLQTRVIAGNAKGKKLKNPKQNTRPLTDRIKTSLFDLIKDYMKGSVVLDLYAGGGNFGIEALSRGAKHVTFIDLSNEAIKCINNNLQNTGFIDKATVLHKHIEDFVKDEQNKFDIIFLDPPFDNIIIKHIEDATILLKKNGLFIFRHPKQYKTPHKLNDLKKILEKKIGKSTISFYYKP